MTDLPPFQPDAACPKCGGTDISNHYRETNAAYGYGSWEARSLPYPHLSRHCRNCQYEWLEAPLDATDTGVPAEDDDLVITGNPESGDPVEPSIPVSRVVAVLAEPIITYEHLATVDSPGGRMTWPEHDRHCVALHYSLAVNLDISEALRAELARRKGAA